jgi:hypothetical protein
MEDKKGVQFRCLFGSLSYSKNNVTDFRSFGNSVVRSALAKPTLSLYKPFPTEPENSEKLPQTPCTPSAVKYNYKRKDAAYFIIDSGILKLLC